MNIKGMRIFVSIMEDGSLARASERNHISQPAASRLLRIFEGGVGETLFFRAGKRLVPTQEAEFLYPEAVRILDGIDRLPHMVERIRGEALLPIRILCLPRIVEGLVLPAMARLHALQPEQRFHLEINSRREMSRRLTHGDYDIGVASTPLPVEGIEQHFLTKARLHVMLPRDHPLCGYSVLGPKDLIDQPYIALDEHTIMRRAVERELAMLGETLDVVHEVSSSASAYRMVRYGMGFTFSDPLSLPLEFSDWVRLVPWEPETTLGIAYFHPRGLQRHTNRERFVEQLKAVCAEKYGG